MIVLMFAAGDYGLFNKPHWSLDGTRELLLELHRKRRSLPTWLILLFCCWQLMANPQLIFAGGYPAFWGHYEHKFLYHSVTGIPLTQIVYCSASNMENWGSLLFKCRFGLTNLNIIVIVSASWKNPQSSPTILIKYYYSQHYFIIIKEAWSLGSFYFVDFLSEAAGEVCLHAQGFGWGVQ